MGLDIVLYDTSPIVQKIFSHVLYPYSPSVCRIDQPQELITKIKSQKPDLVFIDHSVSLQPDKKIDEETQKTILESTPLVLIVRENTMSSDLESHPARAILKKPISADQLKEIITRFVPKTKSHLLTRYLHFPPLPDFAGENLNSENQKSSTAPPQTEAPKDVSPAEVSKETLKKPTEPTEPTESAEPEIPEEPLSIPVAELEEEDPDQVEIAKKPDSISIDLSQSSKEGIPKEETFKEEDPVTIKILEDSSPKGEKGEKGEKGDSPPNKDTEKESVTQTEYYQPEEKKDTTDNVSSWHEMGQTPKLQEELNHDQPSKTEKPIEAHTDTNTDTEEKTAIKTEIKAKTEKPWNEQWDYLFKKEGERIIQEEARKILWKIVPEMTKKIIEDKLQQILDDNSSQDQ